GLRELMQCAKIDPLKITATQIGFGLAPRINAAGRIMDSSLPLQLLMSNNPMESREIAQNLEQLNKERQNIEQTIFAEAIAKVDETKRGIVLFEPNWEVGVIGIVASRLVDRFHRPVILIGQNEMGQLRGSGRSIRGIDIFQTLNCCATFLAQFGGHSMAAGISIDEGMLSPFEEAFLNCLDAYPEELFAKVFITDIELNPSELSVPLIEQLALLQPCGAGNPEPKFLASALEVAHMKIVGANKNHLQLHFKTVLNETFQGIIFGKAEEHWDKKEGNIVKIIYKPVIDEYRDQKRISLHVSDIKPQISNGDLFLVLNPFIQNWCFQNLSTQGQAGFFCSGHLFSPLFLNYLGKQIRAIDYSPQGTVYLLSSPLDEHESRYVNNLPYPVDRSLVYNGTVKKIMLVPDRQSLIATYRRLVEFGGNVVINDLLGVNLPLSAELSVLASSLSILADIGLLHYSYNASNIVYQIETVDVKKDIGNSKTLLALSKWAIPDEEVYHAQVSRED
ncbi:MAG: DHHA1 domain-containing protein, partial [bacterium]|nr:DHHA1 domain-containing protein [bacterium]